MYAMIHKEDFDSIDFGALDYDFHALEAICEIGEITEFTTGWVSYPNLGIEVIECVDANGNEYMVLDNGL